MKKIKIFIGSSVDKREFELERERLGSFVNGLNRTLVDKGIFIDLYDCETVSPKMKREGSQKQHDAYIENDADAAYFLFFKKAGEFTLHELQAAHDTLVKEGRPDVFTYFKVIGEDIEETEEIKAAVELIANAYGHYFSKFSDVDTVKLGMLQYIAEKLENDSEITVSDGQFLLNGIAVNALDIENVFAYRNNVEYKALLKRKSELEETIKAAVDNKDYAAIGKPATEKEKVDKQLAQLEKDIFKMLLEMQKQLQKEHPDPLIVSAYRLLELGKHREALSLVPIDVLQQKDAANRMQAELEQQKYASVVEQAKVRISALEMDVNNPDRFDMVEQTYEAVMESAFLAEDIAFIFEAVGFLYHQNKTGKAYDLGKRLEGLYSLKPSLGEKSDGADLYNLLGLICNSMSGKHAQAEQYYLDAIKIREELAKKNPERYNADLAGSYNNAGVFYDEQGNPKKAEQYYLDAIKIYKTLAEKNPDKHNAVLAVSYNNAGTFYHDQGNPKKAEQYYFDAIKIYEELAKANPERYNADLAVSYFNYGIFKNDDHYLTMAYELAGQNMHNPYCRRIVEMIENE